MKAIDICYTPLDLPEPPEYSVEEVKQWIIENTDELQECVKDLNKILEGNSYKVVFEPGRYIVADSCELISKVLYVKQSGNKKIVITDCSFSEYLRPALYDITPPIEVLNNSKNFDVYDIAGGICESTDYLAKDIKLPQIKKGDYIKFLNVGAYGSSMSSTYNSRPRPLEVMMNKEEYRVIRSRDTLEDLCKKEGFDSIFPPKNLCGDNAAMIAMVGLEKFKLKQFSELDHPAKPRWPLDKEAIFLKGAGVKL